MYDKLFVSTFEKYRSSGSSIELAVTEFEKILSSEQDSVEKYFWLGASNMTVSYALKNIAFLDKAIVFFEKALQIDPLHRNTYAKLLGAYISKKDYESVRHTAMRWAKVDPELPEEARKWLDEQEKNIKL